MADRADIKELAVAAWRLEKWLDNLQADRKMAAKSALRSIKKYISASGVEVVDPVGSRFDPGLAVEVISNEAEGTPEEQLIISETITPYLYENGELIQHARVIIGVGVKEAKGNRGRVKAPEPAPSAGEAPISEQATPEGEAADQGCRAKGDASDGSTDDDVKIGADDIERVLAYAKIL